MVECSNRRMKLQLSGRNCNIEVLKKVIPKIQSGCRYILCVNVTMESAVSVSKGCFTQCGQRKQKDLHSFEPKLYFGNDERCKMSIELLDCVENSIEDVQTKVMTELFTRVIDFIKGAHSSSKGLVDHRRDIPSAAVVMGINMVGFVDQLHQMHKMIKSSVTPHVAMISYKYFTDLKSIIRCIGQQLASGLHHNLNAPWDDDKLFSAEEKKKWIPVTMFDIEEWWYHSSDLDVSLKLDKPPIVIILSEIEMVQSIVLQDFIELLHGLINKLPFVIVFVTRMPWSCIVDKQLPYSSICHLNLTKFLMPSAKDMLFLVINDIICSNSHPLKLSGRSLHLLLDQILCFDFSVTNFLHSYKYCILEHFFEEPASVLCTSDMEALEMKVQKLSDEELQYFRQLPSVKFHIDVQTTVNKAKLLASNSHFSKFVKNSLLDLHQFHISLYPLLKSLHQLCKGLPHGDYTWSLHQLYCLGYNHFICDSSEYRRAMTLLRACSRNELTLRIDEALQHILAIDLSSLCKKKQRVISIALTQLIKLLPKLKHDNESFDHGDENFYEDGYQPLERVKYPHQLREELENRFQEKRNKEVTRYQKLCYSAIHLFDELFRQTILPPTSFVMHEICYFDSRPNFKSLIAASPCLSIKCALATPRYYLHNISLSSGNYVPHNVPDICIAYRLQKECGQIINLYDWLEAFHLISSSEGSNWEDGEISVEIHARFTKAVSELQFLGLIKPTKKKTDHVEKLSW